MKYISPTRRVMKCCAVRTSPLQFPLRIKALNVGGRRSLGLMGESKHGTLTSSIGIRVLFPLLNLSELIAEGRKVLAAFYHREALSFFACYLYCYHSLQPLLIIQTTISNFT